MEKYKLTKSDIVLASILFVISILLFIPYLGSNDADSYTVMVGNREYGTYDITQDTSIVLLCEYGEVNIVAANGYVSIHESHCPNKTCMKMGRTNTEHKPIVCAPNRLIIKINSKQEKDLDAILR